MDAPGTSPHSPSGDDWRVKIRNDVQESVRNPPKASPAGPKPVVMCRVRRQHRELKPDHYAATEFSFGLFDRSPLDAQQTRADKCRIIMAGAVLHAMHKTDGNSWEDLCEKVVPDAAEMQDRYHELERDPLSLRDIRSLLTLDAVYVAGYLGSLYDERFATIFPNLRSAIDPTTSAEKLHPLLLDLFKVENQFPLSLIRRVLKIMLETAAVDTFSSYDVDKLADDAFRSICEAAIDTFCSQLPGYDDTENYSAFVDYLKCDTFMDCMYRGMAYSNKKQKANDNSPASVHMESQSSASDKDCKLDIPHLPFSDEGTTTLEANGRTQEQEKPVRALHLQTISSSKVTPSMWNQASNLEGQPQKWSDDSAGTSSSQASKPERQPMHRSDDGIVTSQNGKLENRSLKRDEDGTVSTQGTNLDRQSLNRTSDGIMISQFRKLETHPLTPSEGGIAMGRGGKPVQREPLKQNEKRDLTSQASGLDWQALNQTEHEPSPESNLKSQRGKQAMILPSVTELRKAGIEFKGKKGYSVHDIELEKGLVTATLHLPTLTMNDDTEIIWRNLVAYEHAHGNANPDFIQFLDFMDRLIDSPDDVMFLRRKKFPVILDNLLGTNEAVAKIFNNTVLQNSCYEPTEKWIQLHRDIYNYYNQPARHLYLEFRKVYFSKPWLTISVAAATILLFLTFVQTYYSAKAYHHRV